jgi:CheY-like chemotaxis protein
MTVLWLGGTTTMDPGVDILHGRRVLVVEDEALVSMMLADLLAKAGCVVVGPVARAADALSLLEQDPVDCAVLDVQAVGRKKSIRGDSL